MSNIISQSNVTVLANLSYYVVPTPKPPIGGWTRDTTLHVAFVYLIVALLVYTVRYAAVFWFTNKVFSLIFVTQLLFMTLEAMFAHCGFEILYKLAVNSNTYEENVHLALGSGTVIFLYTFAGIIMIGSTFFVYTYGRDYFQSKFKIIDKRHHPEAYRKEAVIVHGSCQDYKTHTAAIVSMIILGSLKGPLLYDLVTLYRVTKDSLILTCMIIDVCYMVFWVILWTVLTLKQQWQFRILDYVPLNQPVFMISNENMIKSASYHGGSIELQNGHKKRPSSLPSELTASESGFGDVNSSEDERDRFELSLPPLAEVPGLVNSRRKGSTHSLDRRSRSRRNGHQRVTFHETVKRSASTDSELCARNLDRRRLQIAANVHQRPSSRIGADERSSVDKDLHVLRKPGCRHSIGGAAQAEAPPLNNVLYNSKQSTSFSDLGTGSDYSERSRSTQRPTPDTSIEYNDLTIKNDYAYSGARHNLKLNNNETQTNTNSVSNVSAIAQRSLAEQKARKNNTNGLSATSPVRDSPYRPFINGIHKNDQATNKNHLSPRSLEIIDNKNNQGLSRRDSANYSLTSSQETASNDSADTTQQQQPIMCSQV